ncbi:rho GTPase-activating protein 32 isoform X1 [Anarrhichthys ocellatus]|uniref:rho GTPase-activating protein 32 isoform X1 n=1 Tax=Anarrhichthys ocellatus TaxID=433405 RepID=UPI0012EE1ACD|nr:rho GTPase-activating protein 32-like isoform X1 [Anarrhichthys ocellatus]XP_031729394.1 rho GTPase-activating protein 32-like isoform X1 [Anarrhichthys ocellatus]
MEAGCVVAAVIDNAASGPHRQPGSGDVLEGDVLPSTDLDKDDALPQATNNNPPEEKRPQETSTAMVRSDDITELPAEPLLRSCVSTASMKVKNVKKLTFPRGHFPRLAECAHFHYETVDFGNVQLAFAEGQSEGPKAGLDSKELVFLVQITCQGRNWLVKRSYEDFRVLDKHLHLCIYDRRYSQLPELPRYETLKDTVESGTKMLAAYLSRFSAIADNKINCGPVLTWMEIDNKGNHLLVSEEASINVPAIAAAHVTKRYTAQATDELTFEVGDIVSVIDMPPKEDTGWWRGKHGFQVGFFPCDCVELINDKLPPSVQSSVPKPVCKKHGKLVTFLRTFMKSRPPPQKLRQRGILKERVFGCDLGEYLHNSGHEVPQVVKTCADFIEKNGVVDGIYRLSGISSNIQKLRHEFDSEQVPDLSRDVFKQDIHSVGSLCKLYFRELPNPLLTYQLYDRFSEAVSAATDEERLVKIHNVIQQLPPPHYRTLEYLMRHLSNLATFSPVTNMHTKNLAIVWAPNLLRSRQIESACFSGTAAFMEVRIQSVVVEFILNNTEALFSAKLNAIIRESTGNNILSRPKSLLVCSPSTKLLSLEEAQARTQAQLGSPATTPSLSQSDYIEVGEGPGALLGKFHTVIELPMESGKRPPVKPKKSPVGNWLSFFHLGKSYSVSKRKLKRHPSEPNEIKSIALPGGRGDSGTLRSTKSEESLTSLHNVEGDPPSYRPRRPRSTSEAVSRSKDDHRTHPLNGSHSGADRVRTAACISPPHQEDDLDLCPPAEGIYSLDFDPMSFQCSPPPATPGLQHNKDGNKWRKSAGCSSESEPIFSANNNIVGHQSPDISPVLCKGGKKVTSKQLSPKIRKKSFKTQADVQNASASPPPVPFPSSYPPAEKCKAPLADGKEPRAPYPHCSPLSTASQGSALTDLSQAAQNLPDPGTDRLMSSVSVLPPHPPSTSAARKLALALAESAHKASCSSQRRRNVPSQPLQRPEAPRSQDRPPRPSVLDLKVYPQEYCVSSVSQWQTSTHGPVESHCRPHPVHFLPAHLGSEPLPVIDGKESMCNFTPNVSPLGSGSLDEGSGKRRDRREEKELATQAEPTYQSVGVSTPTQPVCSAQSPSTSPVYVNTDSINVFNFRAVLAETSMPASIEEVIPRPLQPSSTHHYSPEDDRPPGPVEDVYGNHHHRLRPVQTGRMPAPHCPRQKNMYRQSSEGRYSTLGLRQPLSPQYERYNRDEHLISGCHRQPGQWQRSEDGSVGHPAIRRARSFHAPQISHYKLAETEVLPPDTMFYVEQTSSQEAPYQRLIQTGIHPVRQQFENTRADYRYGPYSDINPVDGSRYYGEPCRQSGIRHSQSYTMRSTRESGPSDYYNYTPHRVPPVNRELCIESSDTVVYEARDADVFERVLYQPVKQESKSRRQNNAVSPYESPVSSADARNRDIMHTRSKSDPGNAFLLSANRTESQNVEATSPRSQKADPEVVRQQYGYRSSAEPGPTRRIQIKEASSQQPPLRKVPSLPERGCPNIERNTRGHARVHDQDRFLMTNAVNSYSDIVKPGILRRPGRSQSTRENRHYYHYHAKSPLDPEHLGSFSTQPNRRTQSTKVRPTQYDHKEGYYAAPRLKPTRSVKAVAGYLPGQGCMSPRGHRLLSKALGQEAFYRAALRSEAGVYD